MKECAWCGSEFNEKKNIERNVANNTVLCEKCRSKYEISRKFRAFKIKVD